MDDPREHLWNSGSQPSFLLQAVTLAHTEQERLDGWVTDPQAELVGFEYIN